uniref:EF-hand domain-containing protein n=1 Tax=Oryzias melastigma TaxID=30732 RepID=A0A3B3BM28_ORYME
MLIIFGHYAGKEGDPKTLIKSRYTWNSCKYNSRFEKQEAIDEFFEKLDQDGDEVVDFQDYVVTVTNLALMLNE